MARIEILNWRWGGGHPLIGPDPVAWLPGEDLVEVDLGQPIVGERGGIAAHG